jgi:hypothetical protein
MGSGDRLTRKSAMVSTTDGRSRRSADGHCVDQLSEQRFFRVLDSGLVPKVGLSLVLSWSSWRMGNKSTVHFEVDRRKAPFSSNCPIALPFGLRSQRLFLADIRGLRPIASVPWSLSADLRVPSQSFPMRLCWERRSTRRPVTQRSPEDCCIRRAG